MAFHRIAISIPAAAEIFETSELLVVRTKYFGI